MLLDQNQVRMTGGLLDSANGYINMYMVHRKQYPKTGISYQLLFMKIAVNW